MVIIKEVILMDNIRSASRNNFSDSLNNFHSEIYFKLRAAELEAKGNKKRYDAKEVLTEMRNELQEKYNV